MQRIKRLMIDKDSMDLLERYSKEGGVTRDIPSFIQLMAKRFDGITVKEKVRLMVDEEEYDNLMRLTEDGRFSHIGALINAMIEKYIEQTVIPCNGLEDGYKAKAASEEAKEDEDYLIAEKATEDFHVSGEESIPLEKVMAEYELKSEWARMIDSGEMARMGPAAWAIYWALKVGTKPRTIQLLAEQTGLSHSEVKEQLTKLEKLGYLINPHENARPGCR